ncbi:unnamed protein product [Eruca vesicaria subsp. sativa]|uniref:Uncharacterized protein n=1 Tax=Eruca vesicaria subsp. sativa TaxID=29727 RepID=A0ABC8JSY6_ERUVS|nr:unnamed protein product [Eruca vesicaria subsp. sativa]
MDSYQQPRPYMRPPSVPPPPPSDPYHQYYQQHTARPPLPPPPQPGGYSNQFHSPHSPSPPPQHWGPPPPQPPGYHPYPIHPHPANGNTQFPAPRQPYPQEWSQQGHTPQGNSNVEDWGLKAKEWAATSQPSGQVYQQYPNHSYQDVQAPGLSYQQQFPPAPQTERYPNYATGNESFSLNQENMPTSSVVHQQEVPYSYSSVAGKEESGNATQHHVQMGVPDGGGPVRADQQMQYAYGDQAAAPVSNLHDQPLQFANHHNTWMPHASAGVVYPPIPSSVPSMPEHNSSMAMPPVTGHNMPQFGGYTPPNLQPGGPPYDFGTRPPLQPVTAFMDESYAASSVPSKNVHLPNWLKEELSKIKPSLGKPSSGSFEEREPMDDDVLYKPPEKFEQRDDKRFSASKSSDEEEEEEEDEDEMDAARSTAINSEIKRILTEVLLKVTDELFDEIATKVINEDEAIQKADPMHKASAKILVSVEGADKKADVLGLASYASDDDDADTDAASNADADGSDVVESLGMGSRNDVTQQPSADNPPEPKAMVDARSNPEVVAGDVSPKNNKSGLDQMSGSRRNSFNEGNKNVNGSASSDDTSGCRTNNPDRTVSDKEAILDQPHRKNSGLESDSNLRQDSNKSSGKDSSDDLSRDRSRGDEMKTGKEKGDSQNGSKDRVKQKDIKSAEEVKGFELDKKSTDLDVKKKDLRDAERSHRTNSKEDRGKKREKEKEERSRHRHSQDSSKDKRRRSPGSSDDSIRKSRSRKRSISPSPVRSRRKRASPSSDESSDDSRRKSSSRRKNRSPSPGRSRKRHVTSRSPHSKHSENKHTLYSSHEKSRSKRSRSRSPRRRHRA